MKKIIIGNWKMNPVSAKAALQIVKGINKLSKGMVAEMVICPPMPFISLIGALKSKVKSGAQDVSIIKKTGAFTGEVSADQLKSIGVAYGIVGHSERREMGETNLLVSKKAQALLNANISPVICVGEKERYSDGEHWQPLSEQLRESLTGISRAQARRCVIAYEPIWAIGSKAKGAMSVEEISESAIFLKKILAEMFGANAAKDICVIYGGSVNTKNAKDIASASGISGCLVGRESLVADHFLKIAAAFR